MGSRRGSQNHKTSVSRIRRVQPTQKSRDKAAPARSTADVAKSLRYKRPVPAELARKAVGLTLDEAAKKLGLHPRYVRHLELTGSASLKVAAKMAKLYQCSGNVFLFLQAILQHNQIQEWQPERSMPRQRTLGSTRK